MEWKCKMRISSSDERFLLQKRLLSSLRWLQNLNNHEKDSQLPNSPRRSKRASCFLKCVRLLR